MVQTVQVICILLMVKLLQGNLNILFVLSGEKIGACTESDDVCLIV